MSLVDWLKPKDVTVIIDQHPFCLGRRPTVGVGIGGGSEICRKDGTICVEKTSGCWYMYGPFTEGAIVRDSRSVSRLDKLVARQI